MGAEKGSRETREQPFPRPRQQSHSRGTLGHLPIRKPISGSERAPREPLRLENRFWVLRGASTIHSRVSQMPLTIRKSILGSEGGFQSSLSGPQGSLTIRKSILGLESVPRGPPLVPLPRPPGPLTIRKSILTSEKAPLGALTIRKSILASAKASPWSPYD